MFTPPDYFKNSGVSRRKPGKIAGTNFVNEVVDYIDGNRQVPALGNNDPPIIPTITDDSSWLYVVSRRGFYGTYIAFAVQPASSISVSGTSYPIRIRTDSLSSTDNSPSTLASRGYYLVNPNAVSLPESTDDLGCWQLPNLVDYFAGDDTEKAAMLAAIGAKEVSATNRRECSLNQWALIIPSPDYSVPNENTNTIFTSGLLYRGDKMPWLSEDGKDFYTFDGDTGPMELALASSGDYTTRFGYTTAQVVGNFGEGAEDGTGEVGAETNILTTVARYKGFATIPVRKGAYFESGDKKEYAYQVFQHFDGLGRLVKTEDTVRYEVWRTDPCTGGS